MANLSAAAPIVIAVTLALILGTIATKRPIPGSWSIAVFAGAVITNAVLNGWAVAALAGGIAVAVFGVLVFTRVLNRSNTFLLPAFFALIPVSQWWTFLIGLAVLLIVSVIGLARTRGLSDVSTTLLHGALTTHANGLQATAELADDHAADPRPTVRINVLWCLALGFAASALFVLLLG